MTAASTKLSSLSCWMNESSAPESGDESCWLDTRIPWKRIPRAIRPTLRWGRLITFQGQSIALRPGYPTSVPLADAAFCCRTRNFGV
jgi:hypothetical protein